jgi:hypothetical protein
MTKEMGTPGFWNEGRYADLFPMGEGDRGEEIVVRPVK